MITKQWGVDSSNETTFMKKKKRIKNIKTHKNTEPQKCLLNKTTITNKFTCPLRNCIFYNNKK